MYKLVIVKSIIPNWLLKLLNLKEKYKKKIYLIKKEIRLVKKEI